MAEERRVLLEGYCKMGGEGVAGATVHWRHSQTEPPYETTTDADGHYVFDSSFPVPPVKYVGVSASKTDGGTSLAGASTFFWNGTGPMTVNLEMTARTAEMPSH